MAREGLKEEGLSMNKRLISILLLAVLLLTMMPVFGLAEEPGEGGEPLPADPDPVEEPVEPETPEEPDPPAESDSGTEEPAASVEQAYTGRSAAEDTADPESGTAPGNAWGIPADDVIWFGAYGEEPVAWLVLDAGQTNMGTEGVFLLSRDLVDVRSVVYDHASSRWEGTLAQQWCSSFAETAFTPDESALVPMTTKHDESVNLFLLDWAEMDLQEEQVFFLSAEEAGQYFGISGRETNTTVKRISLDDYYWLRSFSRYHDGYHGIVLNGNTVNEYEPNHHRSARPCMNLSLLDAIWVLPAADEGQLGAVSIPERTEGEAQEWKLIVPLQEHSFGLDSSTEEDGRLTLRYSGADTGDKAMLSLLARDEKGAPLGLWRLERPTAAQGELEVDLHALNVPEDAALFLFCEELNEACRSNYASPLAEILRETEEPEPSAEPEPDKTDESDADSTGSIALVAPEPQRRVDKGRTMGTVGKIIAAVILGLLAIGLVSAAVRRQSIIPLVLLILVLLLAAVVDLRAGLGFFPGL